MNTAADTAFITDRQESASPSYEDLIALVRLQRDEIDGLKKRLARQSAERRPRASLLPLAGEPLSVPRQEAVPARAAAPQIIEPARRVAPTPRGPIFTRWSRFTASVTLGMGAMVSAGVLLTNVH